MTVEACIPVIPSADLESSLRLWVDGLGFRMDTEMREGNRLTFCMLRKGAMCFMLNQGAGTPIKRENCEGIRLYWNPIDIQETRERLSRLGHAASAICQRDYGQTEIFSLMMTGTRIASAFPVMIKTQR